MLILSAICMTIIIFVVIYVELEDADETSNVEKAFIISIVGIPWSYLVGQLIQSLI